jgi:hypothetical protein
MRQLRQRARFAKEVLLRLLVVEVGADQFDGDRAIEKRLPPLVNDAHSAVAEHLGHLQIGKTGRQFIGRRRDERACGYISLRSSSAL